MQRTSLDDHDEQAWRAFLQQAGEVIGRAITPEQESALRIYVADLQLWNQRINLIGPGGMAHLLTRHMLDSLFLARFMVGLERVADLGSGAGFPGLILAACGEVDQRMDLVESVQKKARFLEHVVARMGLVARVRVLHARAESLTAEGPYDGALSRALGNLALGARLALPLLREKGVYLTLKGRRYSEDVAHYLQDPVSRSYAPPEVVELGEANVLIRVERR
ncbi:MAG: 16S rRNA (guanine(527)-N(7))-methyltransferase RsmG [Magnetococcales bacterium]|nr:16S rRNA (guanine(527)-N(7))-methyltransferase RsmG [Magnetococcales bacterium]MBF0322422.1 16S rRNA (guanine(527)-N(7))-methyltransferase RsmG [Magnetococcales bacterium]